MKLHLLFLALGFGLLQGCASAALAPVGALLQCRDVPVEVSDHIVGGEKVGLQDPDQSLVVKLKMLKDGRESVCTGTLISDHVVLTAAHCVEGVEHDKIFVHFRTTQGCPVTQVREMRSEVDRMVIHRSFDGTPQSLADLALLYLADPAPPEQQRLPILRKFDPQIKDRVLLIGFGITEETRKDSQVLRRIYKSWNEDFTLRGHSVLVNQMGARGGFCRGDSGAPIIGELWGEPYIMAVNSANVGIEANKECQTLSIAMSAPDFSDWILKNQAKLESAHWLSRFFSSFTIRAE